MNDNSNLKDEWLPKFSKVKPIGYHNRSDKFIWQPNPVVLKILEEALDQLDNGISLREAADFYNAQVPENDRVSHQGLRNIRAKVRPNYIKRSHAPKKPKHMSWEKRAELKKKREIAVTKRRITAFEKKIERKRLELEAAELEKAPLPSIPVLPSVLDTVIIPEEKILEEDKPIFSPNPGPQTQFLAASEMEVLYGGAAGGELKSEFYRLLFS